MSTIPTSPYTFTLFPALASLTGSDAITCDVDARIDLASGREHGRFRRFSRDSAILTACVALLATSKGRALVVLASQGNGKACALLASGIPGIWRGTMAQVAELYLAHPTGEIDGDRASRPNPCALALRVLACEQALADKASAVATLNTTPEAELETVVDVLSPVKARKSKKGGKS